MMGALLLGSGVASIPQLPQDPHATTQGLLKPFRTAIRTYGRETKKDGPMKQLFLALITTIGLATHAPAQEVDTDIHATIDAQLDAFVARDVDAAFRFASPTIRGLFGTASNFGVMVQRGYPMVWDNADVRFGDQRDMGGTVLQRVYLRDASGTLHALEYAMIEGPTGWLIDGVALVPLPDVGA